MTFEYQLLLFAAGFCASIMNSIAGGGTTLTYPALVFAGLGAVSSNATSTVALMFGITSSFAGYRKHFTSVAQWVKVFLPVALIGGLAGGMLLSKTPDRLFAELVPFLILGATVLFVFQRLISKWILTHNHHIPESVTMRGKPLILTALFLLFVSVYGGFFGAGIGIMMLACLGLLGMHDIHRMNLIKVILAFAINLVASLYFIVAGMVEWHAVFPLGLGSFLGGYVGSTVAQRLNQKLVRGLIAGIGFAISALLLWRQFAN